MPRTKKKHWIDRVGKERFIPLTKKEMKEYRDLMIATQRLRKAIKRRKK